jgi:hypothetical protein
VERVHVADPDMGQHIPLVAPIDLRLRARHHLEPAVQPGQRVLISGGQLGGDAWPGLGQEHLHALIVAAKAVLGDQSLVDHSALQPDVGPQPRLDQPDKRGDHPRLGAGPSRCGRWHRGRVVGQVLLHGAPVDPAFAADLGIRCARGM